MLSGFIELNSDQRRETINTQQRFQAWRDAHARQLVYRGSMVWSESKNRQYLMRSTYDKMGRRRQISLGPRTLETEGKKAEFEQARADVQERVASLRQVMKRQAAVNRAVGLGRVPVIGAKIIRALDASGLLGNGIRVLGTTAIYAYEAMAGVHIESGLATTEDVDLLLDARAKVGFVATEDVEEASLLRILLRVDRSFRRTDQTFRAVNKEGYLVDLIKPLRDPPWTKEATQLGDDPDDLTAVEIAGLTWHESAPAFTATAIDERGEPLRIVTSDPRVFAVHKFWLSKRADRQPIKRRRDLEQAKVVARLVAMHMPHLPFHWEQLRMLPKTLVNEAKPLFNS